MHGAKGETPVIQPRAVELGPVQTLLGSRKDPEATRHGGSTLGNGRALKGAYRMDSYYALICLTHWEPGADHGFTDGLNSMQQAFFL